MIDSNEFRLESLGLNESMELSGSLHYDGGFEESGIETRLHDLAWKELENGIPYEVRVLPDRNIAAYYHNELMINDGVEQCRNDNLVFNEYNGCFIKGRFVVGGI